MPTGQQGAAFMPDTTAGPPLPPAAPAKPLSPSICPLLIPYPQMQEHQLVEQLCCELLCSRSLECKSADAAAGATSSPCQAGGPPCAATPQLGVDPAAIAAATAAVVALLQGRDSASAAAPALSGLFPSASSFHLALPAAAGGGRAEVALAAGASKEATMRCSAPAHLRPVMYAAARCTLTAGLPLPPAERRQLSALAAELGRELGQALKERCEVSRQGGQGGARRGKGGARLALADTSHTGGCLAGPPAPALAPLLQRRTRHRAGNDAAAPSEPGPVPPPGCSGPSQRGAAAWGAQGIPHPSRPAGGQLVPAACKRDCKRAGAGLSIGAPHPAALPLEP